MFNVTVVRLKDLGKYLFTLFIMFIIIFIVKRYFFQNNIIAEIKGKTVLDAKSEKINFNDSYAKILSSILPSINDKTDDTKEKKKESNGIKLYNTLIGLQLGMVNVEEKNEEVEVAKDEKKVEESNTDSKDEEKVELPKSGVKSEVTTKNPIVDSSNFEYEGVKIKNETKYSLNKNLFKNTNLNINKKDIIIFHTHTCESYTSSDKYKYTPTGNFRTTDLNFSVARVGDELDKYLTAYGFKVTHNKTYHDYPSYTGSYSRSLSTVSNILKKKKADIIIDLHRDAIGNYSSYAPKVKIGDDECAQIMFVIGSDGGGLTHPEWKKNLRFAVAIQKKANELYPGLFKTMILRNSRYNQYLGTAASIIEVGSTGNTLEQCLNSMKYLSKVFKSYLK